MPNEAAPAEHRQAVAIFAKPRIPFHPAIEQKFGVDQGGWRVLIDSVWPGAKSADAVALALSYCKARRLDPFKRPVHIVPMWNSTLRQEVETVWPGISEIRTTATRTGQYAGSDPAIFGDECTKEFTGATKSGERLSATVTFPSWCQVTVYRMIEGQRVPFPGPRVMWVETFSQAKGTAVPNARWCRAPYQMIEKCAEAAALRKAFPEELAGELTAEEMEGRPIQEAQAAPGKVTVENEPPIDGAAQPAAETEQQSGDPAASEPSTSVPSAAAPSNEAPAESAAAPDYKPPKLAWGKPQSFLEAYKAEIAKCPTQDVLEALAAANAKNLDYLAKQAPEMHGVLKTVEAERMDALRP